MAEASCDIGRADDGLEVKKASDYTPTVSSSMICVGIIPRRKGEDGRSNRIPTRRRGCTPGANSGPEVPMACGSMAGGAGSPTQVASQRGELPRAGRRPGFRDRLLALGAHGGVPSEVAA